MKRRICLMIVLTVLLTTFTLPTYAEEEIKVTVNGKFVEFPDMKPVIKNGRTLVPVRAIFEALNVEPKWNGETRTVTASNEITTIILPIGSNHATVNDKQIELDVPATIINGRTVVPTRFIAECLGATVDWDNEIRTVIINTTVSLKEIELKKEFNKVTFKEKEDIPKGDVLTVINKWHFELYRSKMKLFPILIKACMIDEVTHDIINDLNLSSLDDEKDIEKINSWTLDNMAHTQTLPDFKEEPGRDPWGAVNGRPIYKKLLPSEMKAMSIYSGKITGKCGTLANLNYSIFRLLGINSDNIVNLRIDGHTFGLAKLNDKIIVLNNNKIKLLDDSLRSWVKEKTYYGFYNDAISVYKEMIINDDILDAEDDLLDAICKVNNIEIEKEGADFLGDKSDRDKIISATFSDNQSTSLILTKYAYQSLYVKKPELYLEASLRAPKAIELANKLVTVEDIFAWIKNNISYGSIFQDYKERIMLADQVIVLKTGGLKDQALLAYTLLKLKGHEPEIKITKDNIYIDLGSKIYNVESWQEVGSITDNVELIWKIKSE